MTRVFGVCVACMCLAAGLARAQDAAAPGGTAISLQGAAAAQGGAAALPNKNASIGSYGIGMNVGRSIKSDGLELDIESFIQGIRDGIQGAKPKYTEEQLQAAFETIQRDMAAKQQQRQQDLADKNKREGEAFLAKNKTKQGVVTLPSGLQYEVIQAGKGPSPKATDSVQVHYEGTLLDGTVFDSSIKRKQPVTLQVDGVIPGWTEALQKMKVGDKWRLFIPSDLAYGPKGAGNVIGPNSVLIFEVELLAIQPKN